MASMSDGALRVFDGILGSCNAPLPPWNPGTVLMTPFLLPTRMALALKVGLLSGGGKTGINGGGDVAAGTAGVSDLMLAVPPRLLSQVMSGNTAERGLAVARFFGDDWEASVWEYVLGLLPTRVLGDILQFTTDVVPVASIEPARFAPPAFVHAASFLGQDGPLATKSEEPQKTSFLPAHFGLLRPDADVRDQFVAQTEALEGRRAAADVNSHHVAVSRFIQYGDKHNAIRMLSGSDPSWASFEKDSLLACVVAAASGPEYFERTTKMAATGLIARGDVDLGVQLLVLVGKADEACRYLQDVGRWEDAVRLAKLQLPAHARDELMRKWADHLAETHCTRQAVLVMLSLGHLARVASVLHAQDRFQLALGLVQYFGETPNLRTLGPVEEATKQGLHLDYGFFLHRLGLECAAEEFAQAGPAGEQMSEALSSAPFEMRGRARSSSGMVLSASKHGLVDKLRQNLDSVKSEIKDLRKK